MKQSTNKRPYDLRERLRIYFPVLFDLLNGGELDWKMINRTFERKMHEHTQRYEAKSAPLLIEVSFYGLVVAVVRGRKEAKSFFEFLRRLFEELTDNLDNKEKILIKGCLRGVFSSIDLKYLNFIAELCVLNHFKRNTEYKLNATEYLHDQTNPKGPKIDFRFVHPQTSNELLIEVVSIHVYEASTWAEEKIKIAITQKITEKLSRKGINKAANFYLVPVLWGSHDDIKSVLSFYEKEKPQFQNTSMPVCFMGYRYGSEVVHKFGMIDEILQG